MNTKGVKCAFSELSRFLNMTLKANMQDTHIYSGVRFTYNYPGDKAKQTAAFKKICLYIFI